MVDKIGGNDNKKKVGEVSETSSTKEVQKSQAIQTIGKTASVGSVGGVGGVGAIGKRGSTRLMSASEREELFKMITEEADKLFAKSGLPAEQREAIEEAVKMTIDASLVDDEEAK